MATLNIIIVEDEMITSEYLKDMLEDLGHNVTGIYLRASKALEAVNAHKPDFVLLNFNIKAENSGIWLAEQLREIHNVPYIFMVSYANRSVIEKTTIKHPCGYLLKPIKKQHLATAIQQGREKWKNQ